MKFISQLINGLNAGAIYALIALGYTMVYGIVKLINFAHGDILMVGAYIVMLTVSSFKAMPFWAAILFSMILCAILGVCIERVAYKPLRDSARISALITAIGVSLFIENLFMLIFKADPRSYPQMIAAKPLEIGGVKIGIVTIITILLSITLMGALHIFIKKTKIGKAMRAVSEDSGAASLMGININTTISVTFAIGSALAAAGGALYASAYPVVNPFMGSLVGLKAFIAAVLGGIGIIPGAMIGGFILGVAESLTKAYISSQLSDAVVFGILIIVLLFRPSGILGKNVREKV